MNIFIMLLCICLHFNANASRGWYVSIGGISSKQSHDISNYSKTQDIIIQNQLSVTQNPTIPSNNIYWFAQDANAQDSLQTYLRLSSLQNVLNNSYITNATEFSLMNNIVDGSSAPSFSIVSGSGNVTLSNNATPTNTTGGNINNGIITYTASGANQDVAKIDRYTNGTTLLYKVTLNPISNTSFYKNTIASEFSNSSINTQKQMQDFTSLFNDQTSSTAEVSFGYKFRPFRSPFFLAPQIDFTYFKNNLITNKAFLNNNTQVISLTPNSTNSQELSYSSLDLSYTVSLIFKLGFEQRFWLFGTKIPFSLYGLIGGSSSFRNINTIRDNAFGFKYGLGGEIFVSEQLAFFGEFYQIQYLSQDYIFNSTTNYTGNAINANNGFVANISNGGTGTNSKTITINYPSDRQTLAAQIKSSEKYTLQSRISAIKFGLTYYFQ